MDTQAFFSYMTTALTPYHAARKSQDMLVAEGIPALDENADWALAPGGRYFLTTNDGTTIAFALPQGAPRGFRIVATHNDSPALRLKPQPEILREGLSMLNIEVYGGPILSTWFDRPLAVAGRVFIRGEDWAHPQSTFVELPEKVTIPSLAAHMKRGDEPINPQKSCSPSGERATRRLCANSSPLPATIFLHRKIFSLTSFIL